jgi:transposase
MHTSDIYHAHAIRGFKVRRTEYRGDTVHVVLEQNPDKAPRCPACGGWDATRIPAGTREVKGGRTGSKFLSFEVPVFRIRCADCHSFCRERPDFVPRWTRHTKAVERTVLDLRPHMDITALAQWLNLDWRTVKEIEKRSLARKYRRIRLRDVRVIGVDEVNVGANRYKTIVRDLESGAVLFVGNGRGGDTLKPFTRKLRHSRCRIEQVAMDMSAGYAAWAKSALPTAQIVFDHYHVIQLMNRKLDAVRRRTVKRLDEETGKKLKRKRWLFLRNEEDLDQTAQQTLGELRETFSELGTAYALKESLRSIYTHADSQDDARILLSEWVEAAEAAGIPELKTMARTVRQHFDGMLAYWTDRRLTNAGMEGFNNKVRWLVSQAYGYHDDIYFTLKIYDLPTCRPCRAV